MKGKSKTTTKRTYRKKRTYKRKLLKGEVDNTRMNIINKNPFPIAFRTKLRYSWNAVESAMATSVNNYSFWASNPHKPGNVTGQHWQQGTGGALLSATGTAVDNASIDILTQSCIGLSKFLNASAGQGLYNMCHVLNAKCSVQYSPLNGNDAMQLSLLVQKDSDSNYPADLEQATQAPYSTTKMVNIIVDTKVSKSVNLAKFFGIGEKEYLSNPAYGTEVRQASGLFYPSTSAADGGQAFFTIRRSSLAGTVLAAPCPYRVEIEYDCVFQGLCNADLPVQ